MDVIVDLLRAIRSRYALAVQRKQIHHGSEGNNGRQYYHIRERDMAEWMDNTRSEVIWLFNELCYEAGIPTLQCPGHRRRRNYW